jgi:hypothetical protein
MLLRLLISAPIALIVLGFTGLYFAYGEVDPCRVLAVEKARRTAHTIGFDGGGLVETWTRLETSQMTTGECSSALLDSWGERLDRSFKKSDD